MSKSILIIDTPIVCIDCPCHFADETTVWCGKEERELLSDDIESYKPDWCPLKEIPEKKPTPRKLEERDRLCMNFGYNACIDEILKERCENE